MADSWQISLNGGQYVFDVPTRFSIRTRREQKPDGTFSFFETVIGLEGVIRAPAGSTTPALDVTTKFKALLAMQAQLLPVRVDLILNGTTQYSWSPTAAYGSPFIREIVEIPGGSTHATHIRFSCNIYVKTVAANGTVFNLDFSATYYNNLLQTWKVHCKVGGINLAAAVALMKSFKPTGLKPLMEAYIERVDLLEVEGTWSYERSKSGGLLHVEMRQEVLPSGSPIRPDPRVGTNASPAWFIGRFMPAEVAFTYTMAASDKTLIEEPTEEFDRGQFYKRDVRRERAASVPCIFDPVKGLWRATFVHFWWVDVDEGVQIDTPHDDDGNNEAFPDQKINPPQGGLSFR
jgi:hypothetical protein